MKFINIAILMLLQSCGIANAIGFMTQPGGVSATNTITFSNKTMNCGQNGDVCNFGGATIDSRSGSSSTLVTTTGASTTNQALTTPSIYNVLSFGMGSATNSAWIVAATGTTYGASTFLNSNVNFVTSADSSNIAVAFPNTLTNGEIIYISNTSTRAISIFPNGSRTVTDQNGVTGSAGVAYSLASGETVAFISRSGVADYRVLMAPTLSSNGTTGTGAVVKATSPTIATATHTGSTGFPGGTVVNASGLIGVGGSPQGNTSGDYLDVNVSVNDVTEITVKNSNAGSSASSDILLNASGNSWAWSVGSSAKNSNRLSLYEDALSGGSRTERIGVAIGGIIGVGYTSSQSKGLLEVNGKVYPTGVIIKASVPTISSCGTSPSVDSSASNYAGTVTVGSVAATGCTITFAAAFGTYNHCVVASQNSVTAFAYSYTLSGITVTATSMVSDKIDYHCEGY